ncbi:putative sulfatase [hydrothermal vent metagenome]|uniref:Putative sulfatase n=1 Tax=hydrothermal vent metagenome TaxID=652676 RepID=A0A1W1CUQ3_9ZZZZ
MQNSLSFLVKQFFLFFLFIEVFRTIFVVYYWDKLQVVSDPIKETFLAYVNALSLDIATASILIVVPWLLLNINILFKSKIIKIVLFIYTFGVIAFSTFIYIAELGIYNEWEEKPTFKIFNYLKHPDEAIASNPIILTVILTLILVAVLGSFYILSKKLFSTVVFFSLFILPLFIFLGARGGWAEIPISQSTVYFSKHKVYNDVAISTVYNFIHSITENQAIINGENPYKITIDDEQKEAVLEELMATPEGCERASILTTDRPNVVLVIWESLSGDFVKNEKYQEVIPNIMNMSKEGILFTHTYSSATLSHEGLPSIFSGWPALAGTYITNLPSKFYKLPFLTQKLKENDYETGFYFGGQLRYGNLTSYMYANGFDTIQEHSDMDMDSSKEGVLGYHDEYMLEYLAQKSSQLQEPFFTSLFTLSSHSPYDQPMEDVIEWGDGDKGYLNSVYYTDKSIGEFINMAKKESWYKNTLFIFVADHSHHTPLSWSRADKRWHHVPMLFYGEVIKKEYRGKNIDKIVSQRDIAATLLSQLNISHSEFLWSRDVFCKEYKENAYIMNQNGFGLITNEGSLTYDLKEERIIYKDANISSLKTKGNIYMQKLLQTYLDY